MGRWAAVLWEEAHRPPPLTGANTGATFQPMHRRAGWKGCQWHFGRNKEVYKAGLYSIRQAVQILDERGERDRRYTIFADSASAIDRVATDRLGPGQCIAVGAVEVCGRLTSRGNSVKIRWTPAHQGVEGNLYAKGAAESTLHAVDQVYLRESSFAHMTRLTAEARTCSTNSWIARHIRRRRGYGPL